MRNILTGIILCGMFASVQAATYTVDQGGGGTHTTISAALAVTVDGDTVIVNDGLYTESLTMSTAVYLLAADGASPVIRYDGTGTATGGNVIRITDSNDTLVIDGFTISGFGAASDTVNIAVFLGQYGTATGLKVFTNCLITGYKQYGMDLEQNQSFIVENCEITDGIGSGIYTRSSSASNLISGCRIHDLIAPASNPQLTAGIAAYTAKNVTIHGNAVYNIPGNMHGIWIRQGVDTYVTNNMIFDIGNHGISEYTRNTRFSIINNVIYSCNRGIDLMTDTSRVVRNNILRSNNTDLYVGGTTMMPSNIDYNCFSSIGGTGVDTSGRNYITADPLFADETAGAYDFALQSGSPCIDAGDPNASYNDLDASRNDMGVYGGPYASPFSGILPVELTSFSAAATAGGIELSWTTATETGNLGFNVLRSVDGGAYVQINGTLIPGAGTSALPQAYSFTDAAPAAGTNSYKLEQVDAAGARTLSAAVTVDGTSSLADATLSAADFSVANPVSGSALSVTLPRTMQASVSVLATDGTPVVAQNAVFQAGTNVLSLGSALPAGTYFVRIVTAGQSIVKRMIVAE